MLEDNRVVLNQLFIDAVHDLEQYGWKAGDFQGTHPHGIDSRCVWNAYTRAVNKRFGDSFNPYIRYDEDIIPRAANVTSLNTLFNKNDSYQDRPEEGKEWAIGVLQRAIRLLTADALSSDKTDTDSIQSTDSGNMLSAVSRAKQWLRKLRVAR